MPFSVTTDNSTSNTGWWARSPYYQQYYYNYAPFSIYTPSKKRFQQPKEETLQTMTEEEFDSALNKLLFGGNE